MTEFMQRLIDKIEGIVVQPKDQPKRSLQEGDHVIGNLGVELQKLGALRTRLGREFETANKECIVTCVLESDEDGMSPSHKSLHEHVAALEREVEIVDKLFWASVRSKFATELDGKNEIAIRTEWQLVWVDDSEEKKLREAITGTLGEIIELITSNSARSGQSSPSHPKPPSQRN